MIHENLFKVQKDERFQFSVKNNALFSNKSRLYFDISNIFYRGV